MQRLRAWRWHWTGRNAAAMKTARIPVNPRCRKCSRLYGIPSVSILTLDGLIAMLRSGDGLLPASSLAAMESYRSRYGTHM